MMTDEDLSNCYRMAWIGFFTTWTAERGHLLMGNLRFSPGLALTFWTAIGWLRLETYSMDRGEVLTF